MSFPPYPYEQINSERYIFYSLGSKRIEKVVDIVPTGIRNIVNRGFGDLKPDGTIDDKANSNNGDIVQVMATIIQILKDFTESYPDAIIHFEGNTRERTRLYSRILKTYYSLFTKEFALFGFVQGKNRELVVTFDPTNHTQYSAFLIKRIA